MARISLGIFLAIFCFIFLSSASADWNILKQKGKHGLELNKKGWHTGSLRNIENVWKAEQKHEAEQKKLEELRKQIHEERERSEFRLLQEQAGLVPKQERLEFLYDSGLAVGKGTSSGGFKALESSTPKTDSVPTPSSSSAASSSTKSSLPGALFEDKQQSANDAWRKLHSDPLLLIRQREQEALTRVKNNPIQMAMIRKSVEATKNNKRTHDEDDDKAPRRKHHHKKKHESQLTSKHHSDSENRASKGEERKKASGHRGLYKTLQSSEEEFSDGNIRRERSSYNTRCKERGNRVLPESATEKNVGQQRLEGIQKSFRREETYPGARMEPGSIDKEKRRGKIHQSSDGGYSDIGRRHEQINRHRNPLKLSEEERAAKLLEMQMDAELHEEQRWKRLKKAEENDVQEAVRSGISKGKNFLDAVKKSVYGTDRGGSSTIEESVRRRTHYSQGRSEATEGNAFRR